MKGLKVYVRFGMVIALLLIGYFLLVRLFGWHENPWLRLLNGLIVGFGIYEAIRLRKLEKGKDFEYFDGFKTGIYTGFIATLIFVLFMGVYMFHLDPTFPETIMSGWMKGYFQGPGILIFILMVEGFASTIVLSLSFMQRFKPSWNLSKKHPQKA
ncbi:DUF4199 domain-containing protein [Sungkyunkwania multivorans]|uniref:DUF4199 domain-containing protein n=1 Tax=Sungkyunkwania multivorans TaxID=1173618 RepID=A0ABW3D2Z8_9FLAO